MAIDIGTSFNVQTNLALDERMVLTTEEMLNMNDNIMPEVYMATNKDDGQFYLYNKANEIDAATGKFRLMKSEGGALVFTKAEWEALDPKPAAGTQVIISDDTIPGDGGNNIPFPDYANGEYIAFSTIGGAANSYEVKEDGFINLNVGVGYSGTGARSFYINGVLVSTISINYNSTSIWLPVKKGDILSSDSGGLGQYYFYPIR